MHALTKYGRADLAYAISTRKDFPGWGYWIMQGATTLWEKWDGFASRNHPMFSSIDAWFYKDISGIQPVEERPGFKEIIIKPAVINDLKYAKAWHDSLYGRIESNWSIEGGIFKLDVSIPVNCTAKIYLPVNNTKTIKENMKTISSTPDIRAIGKNGIITIVEVGSGKYSFTLNIYE
jgi:alpha-L-rhamnosidase